MPTAAAIVGTAIVGAMSSRNASKKAAKSQRQGQSTALDATQQAADLARSQAIPLFNDAQQNQQQGFQGALDIFGQSIPAQMQAFQGGNQNAQSTLLAGLDPQIAAILGGNIDLSGLQTQQAPAPDASMFQQQLPDFTSINQSLGFDRGLSDFTNPNMGPFQQPQLSGQSGPQRLQPQFDGNGLHQLHPKFGGNRLGGNDNQAGNGLHQLHPKFRGNR